VKQFTLAFGAQAYEATSSIGVGAMVLDEATLRRRWYATVTICLGYMMVLVVLMGLIAFDAKVVRWLAETSQANVDRASQHHLDCVHRRAAN
jgi:hypothetical protein